MCFLAQIVTLYKCYNYGQKNLESKLLQMYMLDFDPL